MRKLSIIIVSVFALFALSACCCAEKQTKQPRKIGVQMYTTHFHSFEASIKKLAEYGVKYVECYPGQNLSDSMPNVKFRHDMSPAHKAMAKKLLADNGIKMISYGCVNAKDEATIRQICEFVKEMGANVVVTEAKEDTIPLWNKVCGEYGMKMLLHSHQRAPSKPDYKHWDPNFLMQLLKNYENVGICADNGAWSRSGLDIVKSFKTVEGKLFEIHLKDQKTFNDLKSGCTPYGEGALDMKAILAEIDRQGFDGYFIIEDGTFKDYEPALKKNLEYLRKN